MSDEEAFARWGSAVPKDLLDPGNWTREELIAQVEFLRAAVRFRDEAIQGLLAALKREKSGSPT